MSAARRFAPLALIPMLGGAYQEQPPLTDPPPVQVSDQADLSPADQEQLAMLEARLRVRDVRVREAEQYLGLERMILEENRRQGKLGGVSARQVELLEVRVAEAEAQLEARRAEQDQVAGLVDDFRRWLASPSPEQDAEQRRASLQADLLVAESRLRAQEARLRSAELQVQSELESQRRFLEATKTGLVSPMALRQSNYRIADSRIWRDLMDAERDGATVALDRARRRLDEFDNRSEAPEGSRLADLEERVRRLEGEVQVLRDEVTLFEESRRRDISGRHERFGRTEPSDP